MRSVTWLGRVAIVGLVIIGSVGVASAHDSETVNGYTLTFGGADEPVITGERMWLEVSIVDAETDEPVEGLEDELSLRVQRPFGNDTVELDVSSRFGDPGAYEAAIIFTAPGTYTVYLSGSVDGTPIDTTFQTQVHNASDLLYPTPTATSDSTSSSLSNLGLDAAVAFGLGVILAAVGMVGAFVMGRRT